MKNSDLVNDIANLDNLMLAWNKLEGEISRLDDWYDVMEFYAYKFQLKDKLALLQKKLVDGVYEMQMIRPLPFPKGSSKTDNNRIELRVRQYFHISIEDQLVWIAYCNVVAQFFERQMPGWSFGNRTDVRVWYKEVGGHRELQAGNYRNTRDCIYKKWEHTWPRYRKNLALTIKLMSKSDGVRRKTIELSDEEIQLRKDNDRFAEQKLIYLDDDYFNQLEGEELFWAGIDIEKFYPAIDRNLIAENIARVIIPERRTPEFWNLTKALLDFRIDTSGFTPMELKSMKIAANGDYPIGLPTGLLMAGFLSNVALIGIDQTVKDWLEKNHTIAHFRYVDDHVVLAQNKHELVEWVKNYEQLLNKNGFSINKDKTEPASLSRILKNEIDENSLVGLDPSYPSPLMTLTLQKVSQMADMNIEQLSKTEFNMLFADLQELLVMDISDQEIKKETRISFAVTMLSRILVHGDVDYEELGRLKQDLRKELEKNKLFDSDRQDKDSWLEWFYRNDEYPEIPITDNEELKIKLKDADDKRKQINLLLKIARKNRDRKYLYILNLIIKALEEVPERTRIWIRMMQYCYKHKPELIVNIFTLLNDIEIQGKLHPMDIGYLKMMLLNKLAQLIMKDLPCKEHEDRYKKARMQLSTIMSEVKRDFEQEKYYETETYLFIENVLMLEQLVNNKAKLEVKTDNLYFGEYVDSDFWILYYLQFVNDQSKDTIIELTLPHIISDSQYFPALFLKCMSCPAFQQEVLKDTSLDTNLIKYIKIHHLEIDVYRTFGVDYRSKIASFLGMDKIDEAHGEYITLSEWIMYLSEYKGIPLLHTEHLEYIALKVILSVIQTMDRCHRDIFNFSTYRYINLFNLCIKKECIDNIENHDFWDEANEIIDYGPTVYPISNYPFDYKLFPAEYCDVYDIGVILLQMLTLNHLPSDYMVDPEYGYKWERIIKDLMKQGYMSFYTFMILMACLSKRNRETMYFKKSGMTGLRDDDELDPPIISNLEEMMGHVKQSLSLLKENRVSLPNHKYRTLSVISLESYRKFAEKLKTCTDVQSGVLEDYLKVDIIQTNMDSRQAWSGLINGGYDMMESEMKKCWHEIVMYFKQIMDMEPETRPQLVILPEYAFDKDYYHQLKTLSDKSGCLVIAGRNFVEVPGRRLMNKAAVMVPYKWPNGLGNTSTPDFEFGKYFFAKKEEDFIKKIGYEPQSYDKMYLIDSGKYGNMGLAICADFYDIERFTIYRGRIQHLFIIAYNKDVKSFYYLAEAISRIVFCNVVICNTGFYGGSIAFAPYKEDYKRYVYKHEGGNLYTNQIILLPVASLYKAQIIDDDDKYKSIPPGYKYKGIAMNYEETK